MNAVFSSRHGQLVASYDMLLALRDNVQHHLQGGRPGPTYPILHRIAEQGSEGQPYAASDLWHEASAALAGIGHIPIEDLASSIRTRALTLGLDSMPSVRGTMLARLSGWEPTIPTLGKSNLRDVFADFLTGISRVTQRGRFDGHVEVSIPVRLGGSAPSASGA